MKTGIQKVACKGLWINSASVGFHSSTEIVLKKQDRNLRVECQTDAPRPTPITAEAYLRAVIEVSDTKAFKSLELTTGRVAHIKALSVDGTGLVGHFIITGIWMPENESDSPYVVTIQASTNSVHGCWEVSDTATAKQKTEDERPAPLTEEKLTINIGKLAKEMETLESTIEVKGYNVKIELTRNFDALHFCVTSKRGSMGTIERCICPIEVTGRIAEIEDYIEVLKQGLVRYGKAYPKFVELKRERDALVAKRYVLRTKEDVDTAKYKLEEAERIFERALVQQQKSKDNTVGK